MNIHRWLVFVLVMLAAGWTHATTVYAQKAMIQRPISRSDSGFNPQRPSHMPVDPGLADSLTEDRLANRLRNSRNRLPEDWSQFSQLAKELLKKSDFHESLGKDFDRESLQKLLDQFKSGRPVDDEGMDFMRDFLKNARKNETLSGDQKELLERLGNELKKTIDGALPKEGSPDRPDMSRDPSPSAPAPVTPPPMPTQDPSSDKEMEERLARWFRESAKNWIDPKWIDSKMGTAWRDTLSRMMKRASQARVETSRLGNRARGFTRWMPSFSRLMPKSWTGRLSRPRMPSMPRMGSMPRTPHVGGMSGSSVAGMGKAVLWMAVLGALAFLLWRAGGWWEKLGTTRTAGWELGPWPVRPGEVSTRNELVLAFEHLALSCLGPGALTCHHLELAERMGEQPALDGDRRREAADTLARLYEQARYTPDNEVMSPETMACARRELCYLAGVAA
jgi:hypothetical protein